MAPTASEQGSTEGRRVRVLVTVAAIAAGLVLAGSSGAVGLPGWLTGAEPATLEPGGALDAVPLDHDLLVDEGGASADGGVVASGPLWSGRGHRLVSVRKGHEIPVHRAPGGRLEGTIGHRTEFGSPRVLSVLDRRGGWLEVTIAAFKDNRTLWIPIDREALSFSSTRLSLHADLDSRLLELRRGRRVLRRMPVTIGAPGTETPRGRFAVTDLIVGGLNPVYGCCALALSALQDELPASWPGGDRIAIHATSGEVGHAASFGCLRATEADIRELVDAVPPGAPVFVG